ncbi:3'-5' ssDNA/RNA exonuclease TatD [Elysia marginata]|uniref:3'-5' ssDNA/RNA exonuclease TatD n=1 Tax=Elysia marginata TaxID=1093978 RepID=A0AAV4EN46_9GAST|nr:3'-5' ssDNA/RNA exonuclease TatD [Elysia marginata]
MLGKDARVSEMLRMPLSRRPGTTGRLRGGVVVFCDPHSYPRNVDRIVDVPGFIPAVGIHPKQVSTWTASEMESFKILMRSPKVKALGEVGLDFQARHMEKQEEVLRYILRAYADPAKPVILHLRGPRGNEGVAYSRGMKLAKKCLDKTQPVQLHCFNGGSAAFARWREYFPNVYASFPLTKDQKRGLKGVPAEQSLIEIDAPYLPTVDKNPFRRLLPWQIKISAASLGFLAPKAKL